MDRWRMCEPELHCPICHGSLTDDEHLIRSRDTSGVTNRGDPTRSYTNKIRSVTRTYTCACGASVKIEATAAA